MSRNKLDCPEDTVGFNTKNDIEKGDRIAVRAVDNNTTVLVGTVMNKLFEEPEEEDPRLQPDLDADSSFSTTYLSIDYSSVYKISDGEKVEITDELNSRPQYRLHAEGPLQDPPLPGLQYRSDDQFELIIPRAMLSKGRPDGYYPHEVGLIVEAIYGETIWPEEVMPNLTR